MQPMCSSVAALAVASIFYVWRFYFHFQLHRACILRERVAYMLWISSDYAT
ncbi:MAG: hypothetical protein ACJ8FY_03350 [Gemmataceae bacterium]